MDAEITVLDSSTIRDEYKNNHQLAVRGYDWNNADILDWFFSGARLGYPNISMWKDAKSDELDKTAMTMSKTSAERTANFRTYHEYLLSQFLFVPIYQPATNIAFNPKTVSVPEKVRGPRSGRRPSWTWKSCSKQRCRRLATREVPEEPG